jgi:hypothetical protein
VKTSPVAGWLVALVLGFGWACLNPRPEDFPSADLAGPNVVADPTAPGPIPVGGPSAAENPTDPEVPDLATVPGDAETPDAGARAVATEIPDAACDATPATAPGPAVMPSPADSD